ncbi:MAG: DinB family protein [Terriglobia bacterium]
MHPAIEHLALTPDILRLLLTGVTEEMAQSKPAPGRWSIAEVLEHLSHVEGHGFRLRLTRMLEEDTPELDPYDEKAYDALGAYSNRDAEESLAHWEEQREDNVELLRALPPTAFKREGRHMQAGVVTIENVIGQWAFHDLGHIRQITELVRSQMYLPAIGPFRMFYTGTP